MPARNQIGGTADVAGRRRFASRRTAKVVDGAAVTGWFTEDFTLAELKVVRANGRLPQVRQENTLYGGLFEVPALQQVLALRAGLSRERGLTAGVYPETCHPAYVRSLSLALETRLLRALTRAGLNQRSAPVFGQSFELASLGDLRGGGWAAHTDTSCTTGQDSTHHHGQPDGDRRSQGLALR